MGTYEVPPNIAVRVLPDKLRAVTEAVFQACGVSAEAAARGADVLVYADLRGIDSHGVSIKLRDYVNKYRSGELNPRPQIEIVRQTPATAVVDADRGLGLMVASQAMSMAMNKARQTGVGVVTVRNAGHVGALGYYARMAALHDMIGWTMAVSAAPKSMLPTWCAEPLLGTNPLAFAAPAHHEPPFVFDAAMATVAGNKLEILQKLGLPLPGGWVANPDGTPNLTGGAYQDFVVDSKPYQLPLGSTRERGSHKGYGLALMVDIFACNLSFAPGCAALSDRRGGHCVAAYDIAAFGDVAAFKNDMDATLRRLREARPMPGQERVLYAGLPESEIAAERTARGIPLHPEVVDWFRAFGAEHGLGLELK